MAQAISLSHEHVTLRQLQKKDWPDLDDLLMENRSWLKPWEATNPDGPTSLDTKGMVTSLMRQQREGYALSFVIQLDGRTVGLINVANIIHGSLSSAIVGYWVSEAVAGQGVTTIALALTTDYLFFKVRLHRVEVAIRPENAASLRVVEKLGFRYEGLKERYIHINYAWRDHYIFALTIEDVPRGVMQRWQSGKVPKTEIPKS